MERIRRNKLCVYMRKRKPTKRLTIKNKTIDNNIQGGDAMCPNDPDICHPYEDKINLPHAMADIIYTAMNLTEYMSWEKLYVFDFQIYDRSNRHLSEQFSGSETVLDYLLMEVHYADKNRAWCKPAERYQTLFSRLEGNQHREVLECGNYIDHAHQLVKTAKQYIESSRNRTEKRIHSKKLRFFKAMNKVQEIKNKYLFCSE